MRLVDYPMTEYEEERRRSRASVDSWADRSCPNCGQHQGGFAEGEDPGVRVHYIGAYEERVFTSSDTCKTKVRGEEVGRTCLRCLHLSYAECYTILVSDEYGLSHESALYLLKDFSATH